MQRVLEKQEPGTDREREREKERGGEREREKERATESVCACGYGHHGAFNLKPGGTCTSQPNNAKDDAS